LRVERAPKDLKGLPVRRVPQVPRRPIRRISSRFKGRLCLA
jgi:hypothetical protein